LPTGRRVPLHELQSSKDERPSSKQAPIQY
jgi:hypothetical protein